MTTTLQVTNYLPDRSREVVKHVTSNADHSSRVGMGGYHLAIRSEVNDLRVGEVGLSRTEAAVLLPILEAFVKTGSIA